MTAQYCPTVASAGSLWRCPSSERAERLLPLLQRVIPATSCHFTAMAVQSRPIVWLTVVIYLIKLCGHVVDRDSCTPPTESMNTGHLGRVGERLVQTPRRAVKQAMAVEHTLINGDLKEQTWSAAVSVNS